MELIRTGAVDAAVVRLPIDRTGLHTIPLYTETTVAVVPEGPRAHRGRGGHGSRTWPTRSSSARRTTPSPGPATGRGRPAAFAPATTAEAIELVAAGVGLLVVPQSLARLHHRRDLAYRPLTDAPGSSVVLAWPDAENTELMEEFIGIVRGRTVNSSRTPRRRDDPPPGAPTPAKKGPTRRRAARRR